MASTGFIGGKGGILALEIKDESELYEHYMSFVQGGAIFVPTKKAHELGVDIFFLLSIYLRTDRIPMTARSSGLRTRALAAPIKKVLAYSLTMSRQSLKYRLNRR